MSIEVWNLLCEFEKLENDIKESMIIYENEILLGIRIVKDIVKEVNGENINQEFKDNILLFLKKYEEDKLLKMKLLDNYVKYGINRSLLIIDGFIRLHCNNLKVLKKER